MKSLGARVTSGSSDEKHDQFVSRNLAMSNAEELFDKRRKDHPGEKFFDPLKQDKTCKTCKNKRSCRKSMALVKNGAVSIGGDSGSITSCKNWKEQESLSDPKKIKSLLKQFKRM